MSAKTAVLLMAYGTPNRIDEVEQYYINVRGGRCQRQSRSKIFQLAIEQLVVIPADHINQIGD